MKHLYSPVKLAPKVREALLKAAHPPAQAQTYQKAYQGYADRDRQAAEEWRQDPLTFRTLYNRSLGHRRQAVAMRWLRRPWATAQPVATALAALEVLTWEEVYLQLEVSPEQPLAKHQPLPTAAGWVQD